MSVRWDQHRDPATDSEIAYAAELTPIGEVAARLGIDEGRLEPYGRYKAKLPLAAASSRDGRPPGRLVLVTAITPTPAGEGKTTTTVGLGDALNRIGKPAAICLREPSLGPCFGMKGGAAGGGYAQVVPMEDINLHFTGDFHAVGAAHDLLSALVDNHLHWGNEIGLDPRRISWRRVLDLNDRALRSVVVGLGGAGNGVPRETGFDITVASEVMAILCLAEGLEDLGRRLGDIVVGERLDRSAVTARDLEADGAMAVLLKDAVKPNLVQTLEGSPALVHGGPFANIAHGCNSVLATRTALAHADYVVTEAGFGADLGAEKFFDIKCRAAGLHPDCAVLVATVRALKMHGGVPRDRLAEDDAEALARGMANLARHIVNLRRFGVPVVVALNRFSADRDGERAAVAEACAGLGVACVDADHWAAGGAGAEALARRVVEEIDTAAADFRFLYDLDTSLWDKVTTIARTLYGAADIAAERRVRAQLDRLEEAGWGRLPVCIAKTQFSFSADPDAKGAPEGHVLPVREVRLAAGAGFVVVVCGDINTMPGLPRRPAATRMALDADGRVAGLF